ncbi:acyl carrier protein [Mycobacterium sp. Root265]|uniref:acyl carrier protein n=1 Tax=Mycobacterium sp. Root265 TaxID=1736504 RepID=UPI00070CC145|nr:acyl carrier protein [Mycobacterium sp. Root265]KRD05513.1 acyl carrier protein [Mycobacterium sp. Root265]
MQDRIRAVLASQGRMPSDPQAIAADADLYELGLTSHASVNVMLALEDEFDIEFPDDALNKTTFATIASIERAVGELTAVAA